MVFNFVEDEFVEGEEFTNGYDASSDACTGEVDCVCDKCRLDICF